MNESESGFTLVELAVAMLIIGLLLGGSMMTLSAQYEQRNRSETAQLLREVNEAILGFAIARGRLPCPAADNATGVENFNSGGPVCGAAEGFLPAIALGLRPRDASGYLIDAWGNRIRYAVSTHIPASPYNYDSAKCDGLQYDFCPIYTKQHGLLEFGITDLQKDRENDNPGGKKDNGLLRVCSTTCNPRENAIPAVAWSSGPDFTNNASVVKTPGEKLTYYYPSEGEHDDIVVWISQYTLFSRMRAATAL